MTITEQLSAALAEVDTLKKQLEESAATQAAEFVRQTEALAVSANEKAALSEELAKAKASVEAVTAELVQARTDLEKANSEAKSSEVRAVQIAATVGVPAVSADAGSTNAVVESVDSLRAQLATETDPVIKGRIVQKIKALR